MNGNVATVALANGHVDFSLNISPVLNGAMQGLGTKLVAALNARPFFSLVVRPEIHTAADLRGKVFAVASFGNTQAILTEKHLQHYGLKKGEYQLLALGATPARVAAIEKNMAQGSLMPLPTNVQLETAVIACSAIPLRSSPIPSPASACTKTKSKTTPISSNV